ncbi:MAG: alanine racemase [Propionivibrio sp.]
MPRPIQARIDLSALRHNYLVAKKRAAGARTSACTWAVVKADAYGHGLLRTANALADLADGFALLDLDATVTLRNAGFRQPILLLEGFFEAADLAVCAEYGLTTAIHRLEQLRMIAAAALPQPLPVYLKLNTGMNRLGFTLDQIPALRSELARTSGIGAVTLMTHFAEADGGRGVDWQIARFEQMRAAWPEAASFPVSVANSAAILRHAQTGGDWVRAGIMLYGGSPFADADAVSLDLRPVMTLVSRILAVQTIAAGERVGYGGTFVAERPTRVGIVACGYADGYPRHAPTGTPILVAGQRTRTIGRVSMDMLACDLTDLPDAGVGSTVVLWGEGLPADEVAASSGTISYELFCALARRVPVVEV